ncbi:metalloendopeptidase [Coemansia sp. Benny D115]|nr:metalloendopeptidase [Coemansia sp. Benny D115]
MRFASGLQQLLRRPPYRPAQILGSRSFRLLRPGNPYQRYNTSGESPWRNRNFWYVFGTAGSGGTVYYLMHLEDSPTGRRRFINVDAAQEHQAGYQAYQEILQQYRYQLEPRGSPADILVRRVAERLIRTVGMHEAWEVHVVRSPERNAMVLPGGKIFVFSGILPIAKNEHGLATVLAHEIAHQYARHSAEKLSQASLLRVLYLVASLFLDPSALQLGQALSGLLLELPNSRACELEADRLGLQFMAAACYEPSEALGLWERMRAAEESSPPQFLSTHPSTAARIDAIRGWIPQAEERRVAANCPHPDLARAFFASAAAR